MNTLYKLLSIRLLVNLADSIFYIIALWFITENYGSGEYLGIFIAINYLPDLLLIFFGPIVDKINPKIILISSILIQLSAVISILILKNNVPFWLLMILVFLSVMASSISYVIEEVLIPQIVENNKIVFANSLFGVSYKVLDSIFNSISSIMQSFLGFVVLLKLDIGIFIVVLLLLSVLNFNFKSEIDEEWDGIKSYRKEVTEGTKFIINNQLLRSTTIVLMLVNFFNAIQTVAIPVYSISHYDGQIFYGLFLSVAGLGGIFGNALSSIIVKYLKPNYAIGGFIILNSVCWVLATLSNNYTMTLFLFFMCYLFKGVFNIIFESLFQLLPPKNLLGRVNTSVDTYISLGMPIGSLIGGLILSWNVKGVLVFTAIPFFICGLYFLRNQNLKKLNLLESN